MSHTARRRTGHSTTRTALLISSLTLLCSSLIAPPGAGAGPPAPSVSQTAESAACRAPVVAPDPGATPSAPAQLTGIRVGRHDDAGFDRVVLDLTGVPGYQVHRVREVIKDGEGTPLRLRGRSYLVVRLQPAVAHDDEGHSTAPRRIRRSFPQLRDVRRAGDFEAVVTYGLGLRRNSDFRVFTLTSPDRLVIDLAHRRRHPFDCRKGAVSVVFATSDATPATVLRRVPTPAVIRGALTALYAGPTDFDEPAGLTFEASDSTGFAQPRVRNGIARVRLTGGCDSGGATFTVANEIMPTLKQFDSVDVVKIYDPDGTTQEPRGRTDSIPTCLEP